MTYKMCIRYLSQFKIWISVRNIRAHFISFRVTINQISYWPKLWLFDFWSPLMKWSWHSTKTFVSEKFWYFPIVEALHFLTLCPIFVSSLHNLGMRCDRNYCPFLSFDHFTYQGLNMNIQSQILNWLYCICTVYYSRIPVGFFNSSALSNRLAALMVF